MMVSAITTSTVVTIVVVTSGVTWGFLLVAEADCYCAVGLMVKMNMDRRMAAVEVMKARHVVQGICFLVFLR